MKPIHKRLYTVLPRPPSAAASSSASSSQLPRVRSNSASSSRSLYTATHLSYFDGPAPPPPPPSTRGNSNVIVGTRLAAEVRGEIEGQSNAQGQHQHNPHLPYSIALTLGQSDASSHLPLSPYNPFLPYQALSPLFLYSSAKSTEAPAPEPEHRKKRQRTRYQLDVGAYGIPKRSRGQFVAGRDGHGRFAPGEARSESNQDDLGRAVQVGEDAYFVRDNAMGVADGVGGWSRLRRTANAAEPSPSALFARRLMHFCSEEVDAACEPQEQSIDPFSDAAEDMYAELEDSLEELEEGLDVLMILEKAYEKTLRSHVVCRADSQSGSPDGSNGRSRSPSPSDSNPEPAAASSHGPPPSQSSAAPHQQHGTPSPRDAAARTPPSASAAGATTAEGASTPEVVPLFEGSSTALVAILEHPSPRSVKSLSSNSSLFDPQPVSSAKRSTEETRAGAAGTGAVIRIAHLGDCMGMLVRGEEIVWRTEEMWWNFNTPVQLGPASSTKPADARVFTVPVQADDVLILASDGLSDNLWDADILDEVVRFRRSFMCPPVSSSTSPLQAEQRADAPEGHEGARESPAKAKTALRRSALAGMLSEALCSRAKRVSETRGARRAQKASGAGGAQVEREVPFARRAREQGRLFEGGKPDDISVLVAVISPVE
ncbi:hypothetical protein OH77DRAFT_1525352 [Trametes cingulata]|nr:hypothetical protein OH77DRAFT_1525352 [Trametes cingulata]